MALTFYTSVVKRLKLQVRNFWDLILMFVGVTAEKLVGGFFAGGGGPNLFKTFIKVKYSLSKKISSGKVYVGEKFCLLANILSLLPDKKFFLRYNEYI